MYYLVRKDDNLAFIKTNFKNIDFKESGNVLTDFPPKVGCGIIIYDSLPDMWQTTIIESVQKISDDKYSFETKNSSYYIVRNFKI